MLRGRAFASCLVSAVAIAQQMYLNGPIRDTKWGEFTADEKEAIMAYEEHISPKRYDPYYNSIGQSYS